VHEGGYSASAAGGMRRGKTNAKGTEVKGVKRLRQSISGCVRFEMKKFARNKKVSTLSLILHFDVAFSSNSRVKIE